MLPPRLELNSLAGSSSDAPFANVSFTAFLYVSPVQINPSCDQTGTSHFHSSTTPGSACLISARSRESILPRQSPSFLILSSIFFDGDFPFAAPLSFAELLFFFAVVFALPVFLRLGIAGLRANGKLGSLDDSTRSKELTT